jgi:hypothetical protein
VSASQRKLVDEGYTTAAKAAAFLGFSERRMYELVRSGVISHAEHGGRIVIPWRAIKNYAESRLKVGSVA